MKYIKGLDTLRAVAVMFVIVEHWWIPMDITPATKNIVYWIQGLIPDGGFGVALFFVLSGFLITAILLDAVKNNEQGKLKIIRNFIIRRALRIFPIYYATIIILICMGYPDLKDNLVWFLLYLSNMQVSKTQAWNAFSHTWSLAVEEQVYLIWPWLIVFVTEKYLKYVFYALIFIGVFTAIYAVKIHHNDLGFVLMPSCIQAFGIGGLYAYLNKTGNTKYFLYFIMIACPVALFIHFYWAFVDNGTSYACCFLTVDSVISIWLIHKVVHNKSEWMKKYILENRVLNKIGQVSYGIYLFHYSFEFVYKKLIVALFSHNLPLETTLLDWKNSYFIRLGLLFIVSIISFQLFEKPILKLKRYFTY
jgi:peptidoglycan/LPS O-acetylase OafA/YrhL